MIELTLSLAQRRTLFSAYLLVDDDLAIIEFGPYFERISAPIVPGDLVETLFEPVPRTIDLRSEIERAARDSDFFQLRCCERHLLFGGCALRLRHGYLLGLNHVPQASAIDTHQLQISDFSMADQAVPGLMLLSVQKALLEEARDNALELSRERDRGFALHDQVRRVGSYAVHDFNNFLSIIDLNGHRLLNSPRLNERDRRLVQIILETTQRGSELVGSLQRITGSGTLAAARMAIDEALAADHAFLTTIAGTGIAVRLDLGAEGVQVGTSRTEFFNCLTNLLINARDAMQGSGTITIVTRNQSAALSAEPGAAPAAQQDYVVVEVRDTGPGMSAETLARAFEPHYSTKSHGSGLGLSSVLEYARSVGGKACVDSLPGQGAAVYLYLPRVAEAAAPAPRALPPPDDRPARPARMLLVDDEPYALEALAEMLVDLGYAVCSVPSASVALEMATRQRFDLLLTDVIMPDTDGVELARQVTAIQPGIGVVLMSGFMPPAAEFTPGWQFARKPLDRAALLACLQAAMTERQHHGDGPAPGDDAAAILIPSPANTG